MLRRPFVARGDLDVTDPTQKLGVLDVTIDPLGIFNSRDTWGRYEDQSVLWEYVVPRDVVISVESLHVHCSTPALWSPPLLFTGPQVPTHLGTALFKVDGNTVFEQRVRAQWFGQATLASTGSLGPVSVDVSPRNKIPVFGDGLALTSGQVLSATWDILATGADANGVLPQVVQARVHAVDTSTGAYVPVGGTLRPETPAAAQEIFSYTVPAGGVTLRSMHVIARWFHTVFVHRAELRINDQQVCLLGTLRGSIHKTFPVVTVPLGGLEFSAGTRFTLLGSPLNDHGGTIQCNLVGSQRSVAGLSRGRGR